MHKIAYVTHYDAHDIRQWSGLGYYIAKSLEGAGNELHYLGNLKFDPSISFKLRHKLERISGHKFTSLIEKSILESFGKDATKRLPQNVDLVFSPGTLAITYLETSLPKVIYTDSILHGLWEYYPDYCGWSTRKKLRAEEFEYKAISEAALICFASDWAANAAIQHYKLDPAKVHVVPFGANLKETPLQNVVYNSIKHRDKKQLHLLFIGVDWQRKGGPKAIAVARALKDGGIDVVLHIAGTRSNPIENQGDEKWIRYYGFLARENPKDEQTLYELYNNSHFFIMPTFAECYGLVFCEANAYGLPVIAQETGGVSTVVQNGYNGLLLRVDDSEVQMSEQIKAVWETPGSYEQMANSARKQYERLLNWGVAGKTLTAALNRFKEGGGLAINQFIQAKL